MYIGYRIYTEIQNSSGLSNYSFATKFDDVARPRGNLHTGPRTQYAVYLYDTSLEASRSHDSYEVRHRYRAYCVLGQGASFLWPV